MKFASTRGRSPEVSAMDAILQGLAPDGGLYMPTELPVLSEKALDPAAKYQQTAYEVLAPFFEGDPLESALKAICEEAFDFPVPLHYLNGSEAVLELYHGPTAAFKDFGARFLASFMERSYSVRRQPLTILVATSGDTGGAVAAAFHQKEHIQVKVLFPKGRVSARQEKQLTCWGDNVESFAVSGAFDDCQAMVKKAFMDPEMKERYGLTSANSINLGRLLPQSVYYVYASVQYKAKTGREPVFIIPSGNVGNSVGAYFAKEMGAPIRDIVLATNANTTIPDFLETGVYEARESIATLANAMDVGDPSNMERLRYLYETIEEIREKVSAYSVSDEQILASIGEMWEQNGYAVCPHTASGEFVRAHILNESDTIVVSTAHPAKFETIVEPVIGEELPIPEALSRLFDKQSICREIPADIGLLFD